MKTLPQLEISKKDWEEAQMLFSGGQEGSIQYLEEQQPIARKIFRENFGYDYIFPSHKEEIRENKFRKLQFFASIENFQNQVYVLRTLHCEDKFVGYDMNYDPHSFAISRMNLSPSKAIKYLEQIKERLLYFHTLEIVYGDVNANNILYHPETDSISFCDLDNVQVQTYPIDIYNSRLTPFQNENHLIDSKIDAYMYNLLLLDFMDKKYDGAQEILMQIERGYRPSYLDANGKRILEKMQDASATGYYDGTYLTSSLKRKS